jgi:hypothetical protein
MSSISQKKIITEFESLTCDTRPSTPLEDNIALIAAASVGTVADVHRATLELFDRKTLDRSALDFARLVSPSHGAVHDYLLSVSRTNTPGPVRLLTEVSPRLASMSSTPSTPSEKNREIIILAISGNIRGLEALVEDLKEELDLEAIKIAKMQPLKPEIEAYLNSLLPC